LDNLQAGGVLADYNDLFSALTQRFPKLFIFCHGYDWMLPRFDGIYLWPIMEEREIPEKLRADIIKLIVDRFNDRLETLANRYGGQVIYVGCRGAVVGKANWFDEIHPRDKGFRTVADRFRNAIEKAIGHIA
jgi:N-acetylmuramoyl-L-alanine amidase